MCFGVERILAPDSRQWALDRSPGRMTRLLSDHKVNYIVRRRRGSVRALARVEFAKRCQFPLNSEKCGDFDLIFNVHDR